MKLDVAELAELAELAEFVVWVDSSECDLCNALVGGVARTGVKALRKSVYAVGGVMGVFSPCSCLMTAERHADRGVSTISDGNEAVFGVWRGGSTGFVIAEGILSTTTSESKTQPEAKYSGGDDLRNLQRGREGEPQREKPGSGRGWLYYFGEGDTTHSNLVRDDETSSADRV